ncbi:MAG TPA: hypothetical protein VHZ25_18480 [Acidobacteriaceae bacterium]|nr:hypothetical protein [Acidobacteriaceae bacterium]
MSAAETLLGRMVDYAGLFPPASLSMESAVENYRRYLGGDFGWMLNGFVVPASRLGEFVTAFEKACCGEREAPWTLNIVCAGENADDVRAIQDFQQGAVFIGSLETKAADARAAKEVLERLPAARARFVEFPPEKAAEVLPVLADHGAWAKIRLGGVTAESVPASEAVARFLLQCVRERVAWKATAGLHHAVRGVREVTPDGPRVAMHGFLNVFLAGAQSFYGADEKALVRTLNEEDPSMFRADDDVLRWQDDNVLIVDQVEKVRSEFAISFGSCSFDDPIKDLQAMGWL